MPSKTLVVGPTFLDIQVFLQSLQTEDLKASSSIGGKGFNVARNLRTFGVDVDLATMYSAGEIGEYLESQIKQAGIGCFPENKVKSEGGIFVGVHDSQGETIFDKADTKMFATQTLVVDLSKYREVLVLSSTNTKVLDTLVAAKHEHNFKLCLELSGRKTVEHIQPYLLEFDFVIANRIETEALLETADIETALNSFTKNNNKVFLTTLDKDGIIASQNGTSLTTPIHSLPTPLVSTVGAGDSVTAAFLVYYYRQNLSLPEALAKCMRVAAHMVRQAEPYLIEVPKEVE